MVFAVDKLPEVDAVGGAPDKEDDENDDEEDHEVEEEHELEDGPLPDEVKLVLLGRSRRHEFLPSKTNLIFVGGLIAQLKGDRHISVHLSAPTILWSWGSNPKHTIYAFIVQCNR